MKAYYDETIPKLSVTRYAVFQHPTDASSHAAHLEVATFIPAVPGKRAYVFEGVPGAWFQVAVFGALADQAQDDMGEVQVNEQGEKILTFDPAKNYYRQPIRENFTEVDEEGYLQELAKINPKGRPLTEVVRVFRELKDPMDLRAEITARVVAKGAVV